MSLFRQSMIAAMAAVIAAGSRFIFIAILARHLTVEAFGQFAFAQWLVEISFLVCTMGATGAVSRYVAEYRGENRDSSHFICAWRPWAFAAPVGSGVAALIGAMFLGYTIDGFSQGMLVIWAITNGIMAMQLAALSGFQRFDLIFRSHLIAASVMLAGALFLPLRALSIGHLFLLLGIASLAGSIPGLFLTLRFRSNVRDGFSKVQWVQIRNYAMNMWLVALLWSLVWSRGELPIVNAYFGANGVAGYAAVLTLFAGAIQGVMLGMSAVPPELTRLWGNSHQRDAITLARELMDSQLLMCGCVAFVLIYLGPEILSLFFGDRYRDQASTLAVLSVGIVSMALTSQNHILQISTDGRYSRNVSLLGLCVLLILAALLIPRFSVFGAGLARAGTMLSMAYLSIRAVHKRWGNTAASLRSFGVISALLVLSACLTKSFPLMALPFRVTLLLGNIAAASVLMRDSGGGVTLVRIFGFIRRRRLMAKGN
jgi:O-antigen/teichoic acid export membrane protein